MWVGRDGGRAGHRPIRHPPTHPPTLPPVQAWAPGPTLRAGRAYGAAAFAEGQVFHTGGLEHGGRPSESFERLTAAAALAAAGGGMPGAGAAAAEGGTAEGGVWEALPLPAYVRVRHAFLAAAVVPGSGC